MAPSPSRQPEPQYRQMELNPQAADGDIHSPANVNRQVAAAARQIELLEAQKRALEEVNQQKDSFLSDLNETGLKLHNTIRRMDKELESMQKEQNEIQEACECFRKHIQILSALNPQHWAKDTLQERLRDAIPKLERAENDYREALAHGRRFHHTDILRKIKRSNESPFSREQLGQHFMDGIAFHLPLALFLLIAWLIYLIFR
ncbi:hypothetical protein [Akkermansia glycaniphila]|uniref:Uncharacterized protein n=1 Tax=Akkermansia glycaniphila TaxID=1679444 RepID=A0A1H6KVV0_9BACT|nr:hypothetical protein [Akkermansia glycaniphila]SEH77062.1 Hypothetical protein PYTT_0614 [Akkermansia glycaniphila]